MLGSHRSLVVRLRHILSITCFFEWYGELSILNLVEVFPFLSKIAPHCSDPGIDFFFCSIFEVCGLSEVFEFCHFFNFFLIR